MNEIIKVERRGEKLKRKIYPFLIFFVSFGGLFLYGKLANIYVLEKDFLYQPENKASEEKVSEQNIRETELKNTNASDEPKETTENDIDFSKNKQKIADVFFVPQAPLGEWYDPRQQDGCEEASSLMAMKWIKGEGMDFSSARNEIVKIGNFQKEKYGTYVDTSAEDTAERIISDYFGFQDFRIGTNVTKNDLVREIASGNLLLIPTNGQKLKNPHYSPPGPERHMLVVFGYDEEKKEFIVNDPGTKRGKGYRYKEEVLYDAMVDYPTGDRVPLEKIEKSMIIISKK